MPSQGTHNNAAERSLRGIALGRRNWLFVGSPQGGQTAAILFSVLASCNANCSPIAGSQTPSRSDEIGRTVHF